MASKNWGFLRICRYAPISCLMLASNPGEQDFGEVLVIEIHRYIQASGLALL